jgi:hypothetical protein
MMDRNKDEVFTYHHMVFNGVQKYDVSVRAGASEE